MKNKNVKNNKNIKSKKKPSYERKKSLYGYGFIALWFVGMIYFFILPLIKCFRYSFYDTKPINGKMELTNFGFHNYINAFTTNTDYLQALVSVLKDTAIKTPLILIFSIFVATILNQKFRGRTFVRSVFFLPVIIATGPVIEIINGNMSSGGYAGGSEQFSSMFQTDLVSQVLEFIGVYGISDKLEMAIQAVTGQIFNLVWNSGIQILLFLSALQNISVSAKEAAQIEGATSWEFFWKVTLPYISPMILASVVYTIVDSFISTDNPVMQIVLSKASEWQHGYSAAMAWIYFAIVGIVLAIVALFVNKFVYYEVE